MKLAGHNVLIIEKLEEGSRDLAQSFKQGGGNIFIANDHVQALALQHRWDIDIILADVAFLSGMGEVVAHDANRVTSKNPPLLFVFGTKQSVHPSVLSAKGVLKFFTLPISVDLVTQEIGSFLYDARKHLQRLNESSGQSQIRILLQNANKTYQIEVSEFFEDGLIAQNNEIDDESQTYSLTIFIPELDILRFAVRIDQKTKEGENFRVKVLFRDKDRWGHLIDTLNKRQSSINNFLLASSGK